MNRFLCRWLVGNNCRWIDFHCLPHLCFIHERLLCDWIQCNKTQCHRRIYAETYSLCSSLIIQKRDKDRGASIRISLSCNTLDRTGNWSCNLRLWSSSHVPHLCEQNCENQ